MRRAIDQAADVFCLIEEHRSAHLISKRALARAAGVSPASYWHAERSGGMRLATTIELLRALGLRVEIVPENRQ